MKRLLLLFAVVLGAALVLQAGLIAFAMYVLIGVLLLSRFLARKWVSSLTVIRKADVDGPVEAGANVTVRLTILNDGNTPITWVLIEDLFPEHYLRQKPPRVKITGKRMKLCSIRGGQTATLKYELDCTMRGYYQLGPTLLETGDLFGLHRTHRIVTKPFFLMVLPKVLPLPKYDFSSQRPIGEVNSAHRLFEDPTRNAGVRPYQTGDPLQRVHWRATARTGELQCRIYDPTSLAGATILVDFFHKGYPSRGEPSRSDLVITTACSIAYAVTMLNQQIGFASNGRDAADLYRYSVAVQRGSEEVGGGYENREEARREGEAEEENTRLQPVVVGTRRGIEQFQLIREALARLEFTDGLSFARMVLEVTPRLPRDATVIAILPGVPIDTSATLGNLKRQGFAISVILIGLDEEEMLQSQGRLLAEGIRDVRHVSNEAELSLLGDQAPASGVNPYKLSVTLA
ncbi:DUF58 domain-containing protein [Zavarzinella formosa]|uniref:DUF58 domain-containing protein n=1 Tax=Zavarzinella formosa TaxID=360055 RepID=UPI00031B1C1E|nr:DUF58 domain-containing protein [Zavarzinella formosa]